VLLSATDLMVLTFVPDYRSNSGTLMDAISFGIPCVCSRRSAAADIVDEHELGPLFEPGDPRSLADAVVRAPAVLPADVLARARAARSNRVVASAQLQALGLAR
jgi:glycosyltransferase involved in cell wall biosynthesis